MKILDDEFKRSSILRPVRLTRSCRRILGLITYRLGRSKLLWVKFSAKDFCDLGISLSTAKRSLQALRAKQDDIRIRVCWDPDTASWSYLMADVLRLMETNRAEPYLKTDGGRDRIIKTHARGRRITQEQLLLLQQGSNTGFFIESPDSSTAVSPSRTAPGQMTFQFKPGGNPHEQRECHFPVHYRGELKFPIDKQRTRGCAQLMKEKDNQEKQHPMKKLSHFLCKEHLIWLHYDNCKVNWNYGIAFTYCNKALDAGWRKDSIVEAYHIALLECHARATDQALCSGTGRVEWTNSSTVSAANRILQEQGRKFGEIHQLDEVVSS